MSDVIKKGYLRCYHRGLFLERWKRYYFVLRKDSTLQWFKEKGDQKIQGSIQVSDITQNLRFGSHIRDLRHRPRLLQSTDELNLIALPRHSTALLNQKPIWILCRDRVQLADWIRSLFSVTLSSSLRSLAMDLHQDDLNVHQQMCRGVCSGHSGWGYGGIHSAREKREQTSGH